MAEMILADTPQDVKDELVKYLLWAASCHKRQSEYDGNSFAKREKAKYTAIVINNLANNIVGYPIMPKGDNKEIE